MIRTKKSASLLKRRVLASVICLGIVIVALIVMFAVKAFVNVTPWTDADGTTYYVRQVNDVWGLYDENKIELKKESAYNYYETALGTLIELDDKTGMIGEVIYVEDVFSAQDNEVLDSSPTHRVQVFPHVKKANILSIEVHNEHGVYTFERFNAETGQVDKNFDFVIKGSATAVIDQEVFAQLYVDTGYALSTMKLKDPIKNEAGEYTEYGLAPEIRTRKVTDENGNVLKDENGDPLTEEYNYNPAYYILTTIDGARHKMIVGDKLLTGKGYYVQYVDISGSTEVKRDAVYVLNPTLEQSVLSPVEIYVTPMLTYPMSMMTYMDVQNFKIQHLESVGPNEAIYKPIVSFSFVDISERENTLAAAYPYYFDDVSFMNEIVSMKGYFPHINNINSSLQKLYDCEFVGVEKLAPSGADLVKYGIYAVTKDANGDPLLDSNGKMQYFPASAYSLSFDYTTTDEEDPSIYYTNSNAIMISDRNEDGNYYAYSIIRTQGYQVKNGVTEKLNALAYTYNYISEVAGHSLDFMEWNTMEWVSKTFIQNNIAFIDEIKLSSPDYSAIFDLDNTTSPLENTSSSDLKVHATDSTGRDMTTFNSLTVVDEYDFTWKITATAIEVFDAKGKTATIKEGISFYDYNLLGYQALCRNGTIKCKNGDQVEVTANNVRVIHPNGQEEVYVRYSTLLFRLLYQTMFYAEIVNTYEVTSDSEAELTKDENLIASLSITTKDRDGTVDTNEYRFYRISSRKAYITINGNGGFYMQSGRVQKFITDAEKFFNYQIIDPTAKK
jgi:hypothetical protein